MTDEQLARELVPIAAELVGTVRDFGPEDVRAVLASVPAARFDALAVVLAAMVDPDARPADLLAWTEGMAESREGFAPGRPKVACDDCGVLVYVGHLSRHQRRNHAQPVDETVNNGTGIVDGPGVA